MQAKTKADHAAGMIIDRKTDRRAFYHLFEQGDGEEITRHLIEMISRSSDFAKAILDPRNLRHMHQTWIEKAQ